MTRLFELDEWALEHEAELLREMREAGPVVWIPQIGAFAITSYDQLAAALTDVDAFSSQLGNPRGPRVNAVFERAFAELADSAELKELRDRMVPDWRAEPTLISTDPPRHTAHRRVINRLFTPRRVAAIKPRIAEIANELIDGFESEDVVDISARFAVRLPLRVIAEELGIGSEDLIAFKRWSDHFVAPIGNDRLTAQDVLGIMATIVEFGDHFLPAIEERRREPRDDFLTLVATATDEDEDAINDSVRLGLISAMLGAGNETSTKMISSGCAILAERPDLAGRLRADPSLIPAFVDEVLRLRSPVQGLFRVTRHAIAVSGVEIPAGSWVWMCYASANRTDLQFEEPDEVRLDRPNGTAHLAFGRGVHFCPGAPLARLEGVVAFETLLSRFYPWTIVERERDPSWVLHGYRKLVVRSSANDLVTAG